MKLTLFLFLFLITSLSLQAGDFFEVNPNNKNPLFQLRMKKALKYLKEGEHKISTETYNYLIQGKAKVDLIIDLTYNDYLQVLSDFEREGQNISFTAEDYEKLTIDPKVAKEFEELMDGYMWDDRIYVSANLKPYDLAVTLVHEVNHVINESHKVYYKSDYYAFLEEYRAFYVEGLFTGKEPKTKDAFRDLKEYVAGLYNFPIALVEKLPDIPSGKILPK
jgi:hypothetical protein